MASSAVLLITIPQFYFTVFYARIIAGVGHGLAYVVLIQHFGETTEPSQRGRIGTSIHLFLLKGGIISGTAVITFFSAEGRMDINRVLGGCSLFLSLCACLMTIVFFQESPLNLIQRGKEDEALQTLIFLRREQNETPKILESFEELKSMHAEDKLRTAGIFSEGNGKPLIVVILLRLMFVLTYNYGIKFIHVTITKNSKARIDYTFILNLVHTFTVVFVLFTIDKGRRKHFLISAIGTSTVLILFGSLRAANLLNDFLVFIMFVSFEFVSAVGIGLLSHIYSTEAFSTMKKPGSVAFTSCLEYCLQIMFVVWVENVVYSEIFDAILLLSSGIIIIIATIYLFFNLPETKNLSLRQTRNLFL